MFTHIYSHCNSSNMYIYIYTTTHVHYISFVAHSIHGLARTTVSFSQTSGCTSASDTASKRRLVCDSFSQRFTDIYIHVYIHIYKYMCVLICFPSNTHTCIYTNIKELHLCVRIYIHMCGYIYIYTMRHTQTLAAG